jgi:hypothetical protein
MASSGRAFEWCWLPAWQNGVTSHRIARRPRANGQNGATTARRVAPISGDRMAVAHVGPDPDSSPRRDRLRIERAPPLADPSLEGGPFRMAGLPIPAVPHGGAKVGFGQSLERGHGTSFMRRSLPNTNSYIKEKFP